MPCIFRYARPPDAVGDTFLRITQSMGVFFAISEMVVCHSSSGTEKCKLVHEIVFSAVNLKYSARVKSQIC